MDFVVEKIEKAMNNLKRALNEIKNGERRIAIASLNHCRENCEEAVFLILAELEDKGSMK
ncbi:hypothetical protein AXJ14_gp121 [Geobacillus virus E3]|jgi:hypothetical protein|uniref:hypothetical protein n=1 Tax=Geobacillus virus E3 TaxID=1572712 RepID=UPI000671955E|nr:hypothetical protein AXJ14_gp121 [Geobacillus virus E3]AJA41440.1 hypothetical protein E3_0121 [Geobacillus virus E3]